MPRAVGIRFVCRSFGETCEPDQRPSPCFGGARPPARGASIWFAATALAFVLSLWAAPRASSQELQPHLWGTNGTVSAVVRSGNTIYIGGAFTMVGPNTGGGVPVDRTTGESIAPYPPVAGVVNVALPDGNGGWFIGGSFVAVGGMRRLNLAHILAGGQVASWTPDPDGDVLTLALEGQTLYAGGSFHQIGGVALSYIASFNVVSGAINAWDADAGARVRAILLDRGRLYVGGDFATIGGEARRSLAELDPATGAATPWNPDVGFSGGPGAVHVLAALGDTVYVGGNFGMVGPQYRSCIAAVDAATGLATGWNPDVTGPDDRYFGNPYVDALAVGQSSIFVGGHFTGVAGQPRGGFAEVDLTNGSVTAFDPNPGPDITALVLRGNILFLSGGFRAIDGVARSYCAQLDLRRVS